MDIGIIGGGIAGLAATWLLQDDHRVTLFEREPRLGGHADTVEVEQDGRVAQIDAGFEFFFASIFPHFMRLLDILGVAVRNFPVSVTVYTPGQRRTRLLPPYNRERIVWSAYAPAALLDLLRLQRVIARSIPLIEAADPFITLDDYLRTLNLSERFKTDFLYPFLLAQWCVDPDEFKTFSAYNALKYTVMSRSDTFPPRISATEVVGGTQAYVAALAAALTQATVHRAADITSVDRVEGIYEVRDANSGVHRFDHLILAINAADASRLLQPLRWTEPQRAELDRIQYFTTTIAVHGDTRLMPANRAHWSVLNTRYDGRYSQNTVWKPWKSARPIFRSWVTYDAELPSSPYHVRKYQHPKITLDYFRAQRNLTPMQGEDNLWLAGMYMHDIDCHESALLSAVNVARRLAPESSKLGRLMA